MASINRSGFRSGCLSLAKTVMATVNDKRPVNLDLTKFRFPVMAMVSIAHRISGVALFVALPVFLWMLDRSLASARGFTEVQEVLALPLFKLVVWAILAALLYHIVAGVRHLLMDADIGESLEGGRRGSWIVFSASGVLIVLAGVWLW